MTADRPANPLRNVTREALEPLWCRRDIPTSRIAAHLGVTRQGLSLHATKLGLPSRAGNQASYWKADNAVFRRLWLAGVSTTEIANHFGYASRSSVTARRRLMGLPPQTRGNGRGGWQEQTPLRDIMQDDLARARREAVGT